MISHIDKLESLTVENENLNNVSTKLLYSKELGIGSTGRIYTLHKGGYTNRHKHPWYHVLYVLKGEGMISVDGIDHYVNEGAYSIIPPNIVHMVKNMGDSDFVLMNIASDEHDYSYR